MTLTLITIMFICATISLAVSIIRKIRQYHAMIAKLREEELRREAVRDWMKAFEAREPAQTESVRVEWIEKK